MTHASALRSAFRTRLQQPGILTFPGTGDAMGARLTEAAGFDGVFMSGYVVESTYGQPDVGLLTLSEMAQRAAEICDVTHIPVIADADTGYGGVANVQRMMREFERAGVAGIQLEDQALPKKCGSMAGKALVSTAEMVAKIRTACDTRQDDNLLIIGRTDAMAVEGMDAAMDRLAAYREAGADMVMMLGPYTKAQARDFIGRAPGPVAYLNSESFTMPMLPVDELGMMGAKLAIFPLALSLAAARGMQRALDAIRQAGTTRHIADVDMISWAECNALMGLGAIHALENRFQND